MQLFALNTSIVVQLVTILSTHRFGPNNGSFSLILFKTFWTATLYISVSQTALAMCFDPSTGRIYSLQTSLIQFHGSQDVQAKSLAEVA